jgi:phosphate transport system permease protein
MKRKLKNRKKQHSGPDINFSKPILRKQFRFSDWFAEKFIKSVAFISIAIVILIFLFVFRETLPMFTGKNRYEKQDQNPEVSYNNDNELKPESYSSDDGSKISGNLKPETYLAGDEFQEQSSHELRPEIYSASTDTPDQEILKPERYGDIHVDTYNTSVPVSESSESGGNISEPGREDNPVRTLFSKDWQPVSDNPRYGLLPLIIGTLKVTILSILFAAPVAIFAALYTAMFAPRRLKEYIKPVIELLAGFPSVVIGFFALMVMASFFQNLFGYSSRLNAFVGAIAMGLAAIPIIYTLTEDALTAVPRTYIEASLGLGASIRQTAISVILPAATPGIFAAVLLGIGRVFGETMIALMATGNAALITANPFDSVRTLSATIGAEMAEVVFGDTHYSVLFLIGSLLFIFTFTLNAVAEFYFKSRVVRRIQGK